MRQAAWIFFRGLLFFSGVSLAAYLGYRFVWAGAPDQGTVYGVIFPAAILLAGGAVLLALRPFAFRGLVGPGGYGLRAGLTALGAVWMGTGVLCLASFVPAAIANPLWGTIDLVHLITHHIVVPVGLAALALAPGRIEVWADGGTWSEVSPSKEATTTEGAAR